MAQKIIEVSADDFRAKDAMEYGTPTVETMFTVRRAAWHGIGTIVQNHLTSAEALTAAGLDWEVNLGPVYTPDMKEIPAFKGVYRSDNARVLGIVGSRFHPIQNKTGFEIGDAIVEKFGAAHWEVAGALDGGEQVWMLAKLNQELYVAGEEVAPYFLLTNAHNGRSSMKLLTTPVRVVCQNTLNMALGKSTRFGKVEQVPRIINVRHTRNYESRLAEAQKLLGLTRKYYETFEQQATELANALFSKAQFEDLLDELIKLPETAEGVEVSKRAKTNAENTRELVMAAYMTDDLNDIRGTKWGAFNAVADYSDHGRSLRGQPGDKRERAFTRTFQDTDLKDRALDLLLNK